MVGGKKLNLFSQHPLHVFNYFNTVVSFQVRKDYSFLDYVFGGMQINFTVRTQYLHLPKGCINAMKNLY